MISTLAVIFVVSYLAIATEHPLGVNKSASALVAAGLLWTIYAVSGGEPARAPEQLGTSLAGIAQVIFFLIGAMTIVEVVDAHDGFDMLTARVRTRTLTRLTIQVGVLSFFISAILDNMTTTIVMVALVRKLLGNARDRLLMAGIIVIASNAGGIWSPVGDVTTTMLWIGGQISSWATTRWLFLPALVNLSVPLALVAWRLRGRAVTPPAASAGGTSPSRTSRFESTLMLLLGLGTLAAVPVFKAVTQLPPFLGVLLGLGILWLVGDLVHRGKPENDRQHLTLVHALSRIDMASIVFFMGVLIAIAALEHAGLLRALAQWLGATVGRLDLIVLAIGLASAVVDNVPLVAASMGMYSLADHPTDHFLWQFLAYCAGSGGSILIIGSAAGVAAMGLENIRFGWYLRHVAGLALLGYFAGALTYLLQRAL